MSGSTLNACVECGASNDPQARYCGSCGVSLRESCPDCGAAVLPAQNYCRQCGRQLAAPRSGPPRVRTPQHLAERILGTPVQGERKIATVLFADIVGSTALISDLDAEQANRILGATVDIMAGVVHRYEGTLREEGDGIMVSFGAPLAHEDHAVRACRAALDIQKAIRNHVNAVRREFGQLVQVRIGINSGPVVVQVRQQEGDFIDFRVDGIPTHVAKRLEALAAPGTILLTRDTLALAQGFVRTGALEAVAVKGVGGRVEVCELYGMSARTRLHALAARGLSKFVGRRDEIAQLGTAAQRTQSGHGQAVAVVGEAGLGKSRVFLEFARSSHLQGWLVLSTASESYGKSTSYLPLVDLLNRYFQIESHDDERRIREKLVARLSGLTDGRLLAQLPLFLAVLGIGVGEDPWANMAPSERQTQLFEALKRLLLRESQEQPLCLMFEDLHWTDTETQAFLELLVDGIPAARVLLLVNYRPHYPDRWSGKSHFSQLRIDPLPVETADELLDGLLGSDAALVPLKGLLVRDTQGNPLFLEESVRSLIESGDLAGGPGRWRPVGPLPAGRVPGTIEALLHARIDRLGRALKEVLHCAAVIGNDVPKPLLEAVCEAAPERIEQALRELQAAEFLFEKTLFPETEYTFKHSMTREVAYASLLSDRKRALHARAARALETLAEGRLDEHVERLAEHAERGGLWDRALEYLQRSGAKAYSLYANVEAAMFFERALKVLPHLPVSGAALEQAVDVRFELRNALLAQGETDRIHRCLEEIGPLLDALGDRLRRARYAAFRCNHHFLAGEQRQAIEFGNAGLGYARECGDRLVIGELLYRLGQSYHALGEYREAIALLEQSLDYTAEERERGRFGLSVIPAVVNRTWLVTALVERGDFGAGMAHAKRALEIARSVGHAPSEALALLAAGQVLLRKGEFAGAVGALELGLDLCDRSSLRVWRPRLASTLGFACARSGDPGRGIKLVQQAVVESDQMGLKVDRALLLVRLGQVSLVAGRVEAALALAREATALALALGARGDEAWARFLAARACWAADPVALEEAAHQLELTLGLARACEARPLTAFCQTMLGAVAERRGNSDVAQQFTAAADASYRELGMQPLPLDPVH